jgi:hypothetical protein
MQSKPITSRLRANKQIKKDPHAQPMLHVGEVSPLKQVTLDKTTERAGSAGEMITKTTQGDPLTTKKAVAGGKAGSGYDATMKRLLGEGRTYEQLAEAGHGTVSGLQGRFPGYGDNTGRGPDKEEQVSTPGTPGEIETEKVAPQIQDDFTGISPWHNRQNQRTARQSERDVRRSAGGDLRRLAKFESRNLKGADKRKLKKDIRKGNYEGEFTGNIDAEGYEALTKSKYGVTGEALQSGSSNMQQQQRNQGRKKGEAFKAVDNTKQFRDMSAGDVGTKKGKATMSNYRAELGDGYEVNLGSEKTIEKTPPPSNAKMLDREINAVGVKQTSPMKKGYFKNK